MIQSFRDLSVWQKSMDLVVRVYEGSEAELQTQIELARRLRMLSETDAHSLLQDVSEVGRMLAGLLKSLPRH